MILQERLEFLRRQFLPGAVFGREGKIHSDAFNFQSDAVSPYFFWASTMCSVSVPPDRAVGRRTTVRALASASDSGT